MTRKMVCMITLLLSTTGLALAQNRYYLPHVASGDFGGGSFRTTFVFFNNSDIDTVATLALSQSNGSPLRLTISELGTGSDFNIALAAGATRILQTDGTGSLTAGAARVTSARAIGVSAIFTVYGSDGGYLTESGVSACQPLSEFVLPVDTTGLFNTGVALHNGGSSEASVELVLRGTGGDQIAAASLKLGAGEQLARFVAGAGQLFPSVGNMQGTLAVRSSLPLAALVLRQNQTPLSYTSLPVVPSATTQTALTLAHVANGTFSDGSYKTSFLVFNMSASTANVSLSLTDNAGRPLTVNIPGTGSQSTFNLPPLAAHGSMFLQTDGTGALSTGAATITSNVPVGAAGIFSVFDGKGNFQTEAGVGDSPILQELSIPVDFRFGFSTGIALFNPGQSSVWVTVSLLDDNGFLPDESYLMSIPGRGHDARFISQMFSGLSGFTGSVAITGTGQLAALTLRQNSSPLSYTTLPVAAGCAKGKPLVWTLLPSESTGVTATTDQTINQTLARGFTLSGRISGPGQIEYVTAYDGQGNAFEAEVDYTQGTYLVVLAAGSYTLKAHFEPEGAPLDAFALATYSDPVPVQLSGDMVRNITLPAVSLASVSGTVTGLETLPDNFGGIVVFTNDDYTVGGMTYLGETGGYRAVLPDGNYLATLMVDSVYLGRYQWETLSLYNVGSVRVAGAPAVKDYAVPATSRLTGTVRGGGMAAMIPEAIVVAFDTSAAQLADSTSLAAPDTSDVSIDPRGPYEMILARDRSFALGVYFPIVRGSDTVGYAAFPADPFAPGGNNVVNLTADATYDFDLPEMPGLVTISGRVTDAGGKGVRGVLVTATSQTISGAPNITYYAEDTSDIGGYYTLSVLAGTGYSIVYTPPSPVP